MASKTAYFDTTTNDLQVVPDNNGGRPEFSRTVPDSTHPEATVRRILSRSGYTVTGRSTYPYGVAYTVTKRQ